MAGRGSIGGFTGLACILTSCVSVIAVMWAVALGKTDPSSAIFVATVTGVLGMAFALLTVRWKVSDDNLVITQWGLRRTIPIKQISRASVLRKAQWKQGVGIRYVGAKEWAMLCGARDLVSLEYADKKFHFSVDDASRLQEVVEFSTFSA